MTRVALPLIGGTRWLGGFNWLANLLEALALYGDGRVEPVVFVGRDADPGQLARLERIPGARVVRSAVFDAARSRGRLGRALATGVDTDALAAFRSAGIAVAFENANFYGWRFPLPTIAWFPDLQHRHMPDLFGRAAWWSRELGFRMQIRGGRTVLVSSMDARDDCARFYGLAPERVTVVRFATVGVPDIDAASARAVAARHGLPEHYFYLPNQFWKHKNHGLVLDALARLAAGGRAPVVAMSGRQEDPRHPEHFPSLARRVRDAGLAPYARLLGVIPHADVNALLAGAAALVNPSRFEGWSTTVEEAKALGTPLLLSDLRVHREQAGGAARYFGIDDPGVLAEALATLRASSADEIDARRHAARTASVARGRDFAGAFVALVEQVAARPRH
jgi:glycosyltransferase involved in cell wall biosynthesis